MLWREIEFLKERVDLGQQNSMCVHKKRRSWNNDLKSWDTEGRISKKSRFLQKSQDLTGILKFSERNFWTEKFKNKNEIIHKEYKLCDC